MEETKALMVFSMVSEMGQIENFIFADLLKNTNLITFYRIIRNTWLCSLMGHLSLVD